MSWDSYINSKGFNWFQFASISIQFSNLHLSHEISHKQLYRYFQYYVFNIILMYGLWMTTYRTWGMTHWVQYQSTHVHKKYHFLDDKVFCCMIHTFAWCKDRTRRQSLTNTMTRFHKFLNIRGGTTLWGIASPFITSQGDIIWLKCCNSHISCCP